MGSGIHITTVLSSLLRILSKRISERNMGETKMKFVKGRNNFALTVFVPDDCPYCCDFCTSKDLYKRKFDKKQALRSAIEFLSKLNSSEIIRDVVFTGGEPMTDVSALKEMIDCVPLKNVYINTLLLKQNLFRFIELVNTTPQVKGISVSRHMESQEIEIQSGDLRAEDFCVDGFQKSVRINVVVRPKMDEEETKKFVQNVLNRWKPYNVVVNFRADYRNVNLETLHSFQDAFFKVIAQDNDLIERTFCDVCDTSLFKWNSSPEKKFTYHRGLENSSIQIGDTLIINDAIMIPTVRDQQSRYELVSDWNRKEAYEGFEHWLIRKELDINKLRKILNKHANKAVILDQKYRVEKSPNKLREIGFNECGERVICG